MFSDDRQISIMIVPPGDTKTINLNIGIKKIYITGSILLIFIICLIYFLFNYGRLQMIAHHAEYLKVENKRLAEENRKVALLSEKLANLKNMENKIRQMTTSQIDNGTYTPTPAELLQVEKNEEKFSFRPQGLKTNDDSKDELTELISKQKAASEAIPSINPVKKSWISQSFSVKHPGIDLAAPMYTPIKAAAEGEIIFADEMKGLGNCLIINHHNEVKTKYGHLHRFTVSKGDFIKKGEIIGFVGNSGNSSAPHLHYEIHRSGVPIDPLPFINQQNNN